MILKSASGCSPSSHAQDGHGPAVTRGMGRPPVRIAVIDDDEAVRTALARVLRAEDLDADVFPSGEAFLSSLKSARPDCIVLDFHMPRMNGLDLLRRLKANGLQLHVVVITGHDDPQTCAQCLSAGAAAYLRKPIDTEALLSAICGRR